MSIVPVSDAAASQFCKNLCDTFSLGVSPKMRRRRNSHLDRFTV